MRPRHFTDESLEQLLAFLAAAHPRAAAGGGKSCPWGRLPESLQRRVAALVLEPHCDRFVRWDPMAVVRGGKSLEYGLRLRRRCALHFRAADDEGVAVCGSPMAPGTGVYEVEFSVKELLSVDGFWRTDIGVVLDPTNPERNGSGIWWEAGDGDVFVAEDAKSASPRGKSGWIGDEKWVEEGVLPRWDRVGKAGVVVDTFRQRIGFTQHGDALPFELPLPPGATVHFAVGWSGGTMGSLRLERLERLVPEVHGPTGALLALLRQRPSEPAAAAQGFLRARTDCPVTPELVADVAEAVDAQHLGSTVAVLARAHSSQGFSSAFIATAARSLRLYSSQRRLAAALSRHAADPWNLDGALPFGRPQSRWRRWLERFCWCCR